MSKRRLANGHKPRSLPAAAALYGGTFPTSRPVLHDREPDPDSLPTERIEPAEPRAPTPPDQIGGTLVISILEQMARTHVKLAEDCRKLLETMRDPNEVA